MVSPESNKKYEKFIIDAIDPSGYEPPVKAKTPKEKLQFLKDTFKAEYGHQIQRVGEQNAFREWLMCLPSAIDLPLYDAETIALAKRMGSLPENATEKQEDRVNENYWNFMTVHIFKAFRKYGVK